MFAVLVQGRSIRIGRRRRGVGGRRGRRKEEGGWIDWCDHVYLYGRIIPYYAVRIIQKVYYGSTIQYVLLEGIRTAVRNNV